MTNENSSTNRKYQEFSNGYHVVEDEEDGEYSDSDFEEVDSGNMETSSTKILNLEDCIVDERNKKLKNLNDVGKTNRIENLEIFETSSEYEEMPEFYTLLKDGYTYFSTDVELGNDFDFSKQTAQLKSNSKLTVLKIDDQRISIDVGRMLWNDIQTEACLFIFIQKNENNKMNYLITSTIPCHPVYRSLLKWSRKLGSKRSILETIEYIAAKFSEFMNITSSFKKVSSYFKHQTKNGKPFGYLEKIEFDMEWRHPVYTTLPNENEHKSWAFGFFSSNVGKKQKWTDVWKEVGEASNDSSCTFPGTANSSDFPDYECKDCRNTEKAILYKMKDGHFQCVACVRKLFFTKFRVGKVPIHIEFELQEGVTSLDILASVIPLQLLNFYVFDVRSCPSCKSILIFGSDHQPSTYDSVSCPCGYTWCSKCSEVPHWPMSCSEFDKWNENWQWRYDSTVAIGKPSRILARVLCYCQNSLFYTWSGTCSVSCPVCGITLFFNYLWSTNCSDNCSLERVYYKENPKKTRTVAAPTLMDFKCIDQLPIINKNILSKCAKARHDRFNLEVINKIRVKNGTSKRMKTISQTILYLTENVTAWMYIRKSNYLNIEKMLKELNDKREMMINDENKRSPEFYEKVEDDIRKLMDIVDKKKNAA